MTNPVQSGDLGSSADADTHRVAETPVVSGHAITKAFTDEKGNRFIYPSMVIWPQDDDPPAKHDLILQAMGLDLALGTKADKEWFEFDPNNFPHIRTEIGHRNFAHGGATILLFAGPEFDDRQQATGETQ